MENKQWQPGERIPCSDPTGYVDNEADVDPSQTTCISPAPFTIYQYTGREDHQLSDAQVQHMDNLVNTFRRTMTRKYRAGQKEHGGNLWEKKNLIDCAIDEAIDQVTYLLTLKDQLTTAGVTLGTVED